MTKLRVRIGALAFMLGAVLAPGVAKASPTVFHLTGTATRYSPTNMPPDISRANWTGPQMAPAEEPAYDAQQGGYLINITLYGSRIVAGACQQVSQTYGVYTTAGGNFGIYSNDWEPSCGGWGAIASSPGGESMGSIRSTTQQTTASLEWPLAHLPSLPNLVGPYWTRRIGMGSKPVFFIEGFDPGDDRTQFNLPLEDGTPIVLSGRSFVPAPGSQYVDNNASWGGPPTIVNVSDTTAIIYLLASARLNTSIGAGLLPPPASAFSGYNTAAPNQPNMLAYLLQNDYSVYIVTASAASGGSIRGLGGTTTGSAYQAIATIRSAMTANHMGKQAIIGGHSQGGLVARDGLKKWCDGSWASLNGDLRAGCAEVALWYAFDSPLEGARMPPAIQAVMRDAKSSQISAVGSKVSQLNLPAAKEMIAEYINQNAVFLTGCFDGGADCHSNQRSFWTCGNGNCNYDTSSRVSLINWETSDPWPRRDGQVLPAIGAAFGESPTSALNSDFVASGVSNTASWAHMVAYQMVAKLIPAGLKVDVYGNSADTPGAPTRPAGTTATPNPIDDYAAGSISGGFDSLKNGIETIQNPWPLSSNIANINVRPTFIPSKSALAWSSGGQSAWRAYWHQPANNPSGGYQHLGALPASPGLVGFILGYWDEYSSGSQTRLPDGYGWKMENATSGYGTGRPHADGDCDNGIDDDGDSFVDNSSVGVNTPDSTTVCNPGLHERVIDSKEPGGPSYMNDSACVWNTHGQTPSPFPGSSRAHVCTVSPWIVNYPAATGPSVKQLIGKGDYFYFDVWIDPDPNNQPQLIGLQVLIANSWEHRAYWGYDHPSGPWVWGVDGTASFKYQGPLPPRGVWTKMKFKASDLGLEGLQVDAVSWIQVGGRVGYGKIGLTQFTETVLVDGALPIGGGINYTDGTAWNWAASPVMASSASHANLQNYDVQQHYVYNSFITGLYAKDELVTWTYDALNNGYSAGEVMLQFNTAADGWEHRAYWGMNSIIAWGTDQTPSRARMSLISGTYWDAPSLGAHWAALRVPVASVGLVNQSIRGLAYSQYYGTNYFDRSSVLRDATDFRPALSGVPLSSRWNAGKCLDVNTASAGAAGPIQGWDCSGGTNQSWDLVPSRFFPDLPGAGEVGDGHVMIRSLYSGMCLQVSGGSRSNGALIEQQPCVAYGDVDYDAQHWALVRPDQTSSDGGFQLRNKRSSKCLDLTGPSASNGTTIQQWDCLGATQPNQVWIPAQTPLIAKFPRPRLRELKL